MSAPFTTSSFSEDASISRVKPDLDDGSRKRNMGEPTPSLAAAEPLAQLRQILENPADIRKRDRLERIAALDLHDRGEIPKQLQ
jgi:hypothetical protein